MSEMRQKILSFFRSRTGIALLVFIGVGTFLLGYEHRAHVFGSNWLLFALLGLCILMHVFMHGGHGHGGHGGGDGPKHRGHGDDKGGAGDDR